MTTFLAERLWFFSPGRSNIPIKIIFWFGGSDKKKKKLYEEQTKNWNKTKIKEKSKRDRDKWEKYIINKFEMYKAAIQRKVEKEKCRLRIMWAGKCRSSKDIWQKSGDGTWRLFTLCHKHVSYFTGCSKPSHLVVYVDSINFRMKKTHFYRFVVYFLSNLISIN